MNTKTIVIASPTDNELIGFSNYIFQIMESVTGTELEMVSQMNKNPHRDFLTVVQCGFTCDMFIRDRIRKLVNSALKESDTSVSLNERESSLDYAELVVLEPQRCRDGACLWSFLYCGVKYDYFHNGTSKSYSLIGTKTEDTDDLSEQIHKLTLEVSDRVSNSILMASRKMNGPIKVTFKGNDLIQPTVVETIEKTAISMLGSFSKGVITTDPQTDSQTAIEVNIFAFCPMFETAVFAVPTGHGDCVQYVELLLKDKNGPYSKNYSKNVFERIKNTYECGAVKPTPEIEVMAEKDHKPVKYQSEEQCLEFLEQFSKQLLTGNKRYRLSSYSDLEKVLKFFKTNNNAVYAYLDNAITQMVQDTRFEHEAFFTSGEFGLHVKGPSVVNTGKKIQFLLKNIEQFNR